MSIIDINHLNVSYRIGYKTIFVLKNINLSVNSGDYLCILGNNGSGKSTLIKTILGLNPISSGEIKINCPKSDISYLPQASGLSSNFPATVEEVVLSGTQSTHNKFKLPLYSKENKIQAEIAMEKAKIITFSKRRFGELSGGQKQRVLFARSIVKNPKILILDEPCTGLDHDTSENFYELLSKVNAQDKTTIIMVSHDLSAVKKFDSKVVILSGELKFCGSVAEWEKYHFCACGGNL